MTTAYSGRQKTSSSRTEIDDSVRNFTKSSWFFEGIKSKTPPLIPAWRWGCDVAVQQQVQVPVTFVNNYKIMFDPSLSYAFALLSLFQRLEKLKEDIEEALKKKLIQSTLLAYNSYVASFEITDIWQR